MRKKIISQEQREYERSQKLNYHLQGLKDLYEDDVFHAVQLAYQLGATQEDVAKALGKSRSTIAMLYPKKEKRNE